MTEINYQEHGETIRISIVGHALYSSGNDIVCAAISNVTCQLLNILTEMKDDAKIFNFVMDMNDGSVILSFQLAPEFVDEWSIIWHVIWTGYAQIQQNYPENIRID